MAVVALPLLLLLLLGSSPTALVAVAADGEHEAAQFTVLDMTLLKPHDACSGHRVTPSQNGSWVPLYHPLGPCSPSFKGGAARAKPPSLADLLRQDQLRARHIHRMASGDFRVSKGSRKSPVWLEESQIHNKQRMGIDVKYGSQFSRQQMHGPAAATDDDGGGGDGSSGESSPGVTQTVVLDTASDVPWINCVPCALAECPYYDPSRSTTYAAFPCNSTACKQLGRYANGCVNNQCQYRVNSTSGPTSSGTYGSDVLTLDSHNAITGFKFGCNNNDNNGDDSSGNNNGIMALGRGAQSLMAQASSTYGNAFSYCIPPRDSEKGFFRIGVPGGAPYMFVTTPMLTDRRSPSLYRAALVGISVAGERLNVPPEAFAASAVLDSRTALTRLPLTAYGALRAAFRDKMAAYRRAPATEEMDTCYNFTGVRFVKLPKVALVFDGNNAVVELDKYGILVGGGEDDHGCLAFTANSNDAAPAILGNVQQKTIEVLHDVADRNIGFRRLAC
nr:unnamed protein product [Digitaria exilis]